jgi:hypothetical protein
VSRRCPVLRPQVNWMRYITTMKKRHKFVNAVSVTTTFMTVM